MPARGLARRLGAFHATMLVMGGIVGSGIFVNPHVVAREVGTPFLILAAWVAGGAIALAGAFIYADLAARFPEAGGQYVYLRNAYHPMVAFLYGWSLLLVVQSGGMAAVAVTFARYAPRPAGGGWSERGVAVATLVALAVVNCLGVRAGATVQSTLMVLKIAAIGILALCGFTAGSGSRLSGPWFDGAGAGATLAAFGAALTPVLFAYGGWQTAAFVAGEMRDPARDLKRGLLFGVAGVVALYLAVNLACLRVLGASGLAAAPAPATAVMEAAFGAGGGRFIAAGIAVSTLGFLAQSMLTAPRVYYAMANDGLFFRRVGAVNARTAVPVWAVLLQGAVASLIALSGRYEQILSYVVSVDFLWFGLTGLALLVFARRPAAAAAGVPGQPWTTLFFVAACWAVAGATIFNRPFETGIGLLILISGVPVYFAWRGRLR